MMLLVLGQGMRFTLIGLVLGIAAAAALAHLAAAVLISVSSVDPAVYALAAAFTVTISALSAALPAWRALRVDPMVALRQ
jgi:putative ABC transport system permease protein